VPLILRAEDDIFRLEPFVDSFVNLTNTQGAMGDGLSLIYKKKFPDMYESYLKLCANGDIKIGNLYFHQTHLPISIICLPTRAHWSDGSSLEDVNAACLALHRFLILPQNKNRSISMPMIICNHDNSLFDSVFKIMHDILDSLPNIIHVCRRPSSFTKIPTYLAIVGDRKIDNYDLVKDISDRALSEWGVSYRDFDALISGGASGVDTIACATIGRCIADDVDVRKIIYPADWSRYGRSAGMIRNKRLIDIATHVVAIPTKTSIGTRHTILHIQKVYTGDVPIKKLLYIHNVD
jgi:hypothetical protein